MTDNAPLEHPLAHLPGFAEVRPRLGRAFVRFAGTGLTPVILFYIGYKLGGPVPGILCGMAAVLVALAVQAVRMKRLDPIALAPVCVITIQGAIAAMIGSVELYLAAPAVEAILWGTILVGSVVARRPLVPLIARELDVVPERIANSVDLRRALVWLTLAWGIAGFVKAGVRLWLLTLLPLEVFLVVVTLSMASINLCLLALSVWLPFRMVRRGALATTGAAT
jgi:intracellular septation protein A